jgi:hypothetical protein
MYLDCFIIGSCVGQRNQKFFFLMLLFYLISTTIKFIACLINMMIIGEIQPEIGHFCANHYIGLAISIFFFASGIVCSCLNNQCRFLLLLKGIFGIIILFIIA